MPYGSKERKDFLDGLTPEQKSEAYRRAEAKSKSMGDSIVVFDPNDIRSPNAAFDPEYTGPNIMGGISLPVAGGLLAAGQSEDADAGFITRGGKTLLEAWHGSPHKFDRFSMDQIGTGEGAQAYGHGLYFADEIDVAKGYQPRDRANEEWMYEQYKAAEEAGDQYMMDAWERAMMHDSPIELRASAADPDYDEYSQAAFAEVADALEANPGTGSLSRVEIDVTPESLLDWDKPLSADTPQQMKDAINTLVKNNPDLKNDLYQAYRENQPGSIYYSLLSDYAKTGDIVKNQQFATQQLNDAGIKGIKYLDGDSRAAGNGTSNYVIFDDSLINITERGNATVPMLATTAGLSGAGLLASQIKDSGMISAPRSETLFDLTMGARDLERRLEGSPASLLFPSGLIEYLETVNRREEDPNAMTRGMALLDVLPW